MNYILSIFLFSIISIQSHSLEIVYLEEQVEALFLGATPILTNIQDPEKAFEQAKLLCEPIARIAKTSIVVTRGDQSKKIGYRVYAPDFALGVNEHTCMVVLLNN
ncbi:MAG: hypothetical protein VX642_08525 [Bdellovibrionota bacterium]|nr:hypothetical protein [Bdellovibrionota bacterium]